MTVAIPIHETDEAPPGIVAVVVVFDGDDENDYEGEDEDTADDNDEGLDNFVDVVGGAGGDKDKEGSDIDSLDLGVNFAAAHPGCKSLTVTKRQKKNLGLRFGTARED